jgi:thiamine biosynthesis lipoprotein
MTRALRAFLVSAFVCAGLRVGSGPLESAEEASASELWHVMGTFATVTVPSKDREKLKACVAAAQEVMSDINGALSTYKEDSEISRLNRASGKEPVEISKHSREALELSLKYSRMTSGAFDPTVLPLCRLWGFSGGSRPSKVPDKSSIDAALRLVGHSRLSLSDGKAKLEIAGMGLDLGGIGKGYAVDAAFQKVSELGTKDFLINLGGNIRCRGLAEGTRPWIVGVRDPFAAEDLVGTLELAGDVAVATSGNYEQFVILDGERYTHILDPRTGTPVKGMAGVTIVSATAVEADALSTALFVLGPEKGPQVLASFPQSRALFVPDKKPVQILVTPGLQKYFKPRPAFARSVTVLDQGQLPEKP